MTVQSVAAGAIDIAPSVKAIPGKIRFSHFGLKGCVTCKVCRKAVCNDIVVLRLVYMVLVFL